MRAHNSLALPRRRADLVTLSLSCDHCRVQLRRNEHRYWHMRFCSAACVSAYQQRLSPETHEKVLALDISGPFLKTAS